MKKTLNVLLCTALFISFSSFAKEELSLTAKDGFILKADYLSPESKSERAILMLHQCNADRSMYHSLALSLRKKGFHVLNLDFRGFGESIDAKTNIDIVSTLPEEERRPYWSGVNAHYEADVELAYQALVKRSGGKPKLGLIGASCGGWQARIVASKHPVETLIFFSAPIFNQEQPESIEQYKKHISTLPSLFVSAEKDFVYEVTKKAVTLNRNPHSKFISYPGEAHGLPLFEEDKELEGKMLSWFDKQVSK